MNGLSSLSASGGLQAAMRTFDRSARAIAQASARASNGLPDSATGGSGLIDSMVSMRVAASDVKANVAVVHTADEMLGALLDMKA